MNFNNYDEWEAAAEYLRNEENKTAEDLRQAFEVEELTIVECFAADNGLISTEEELSQVFDDTIWPLLVEQGMQDDYPAIREEFNNWTDMLCKDEELHDLQYQEYTYCGDAARAAFQ